jgi:hypothetical protein
VAIQQQQMVYHKKGETTKPKREIKLKIKIKKIIHISSFPHPTKYVIPTQAGIHQHEVFISFKLQDKPKQGNLKNCTK